MKYSILKKIDELSKQDQKDLVLKQVKLSEEVGEVARALLPYTGSPGSSYRDASRQEVLEELVDVAMVALSMATDLQASPEEVEETFHNKLKKWEKIQKEMK